MLPPAVQCSSNHGSIVTLSSLVDSSDKIQILFKAEEEEIQPHRDRFQSYDTWTHM